MPSTRGTNATLSSTVLSGSSLKSWNTKPSERRYDCTCRGERVARLRPPTIELSFRGHVLPEQQPQQRRLARAARPGEEYELALVDAQRQLAQRVDAAAYVFETLWASITAVSLSGSVQHAPHELVDERGIGLARSSPSSPDRRGTRTSASCRRDTAPPRRRARRARRRTAASIAASSSMRPSPSASTISAARRPVAYIFSKTSLAIGPLIVPESISRIKPASASGPQRHVVDSGAASRSSCASASPITQLLAAFGLPDAAATWPRSSRERQRLCQHAGIVLGQRVLRDEAAAARLGQLRQRAPRSLRSRRRRACSGGRSGSGK